MRIVYAFAASLVVGWALGHLVFDVPRTWPLVAVMVLVGLVLPFASRLGEPTEGRVPGRRLPERH